MRKNYVYFVLLLLLNISMFGQKVTLTPTLVNGMGYSGGSINLGSLPTSTISLSAKVDIPSSAAVGDQGTIKIYFSKGTALGSNVANNGDGGVLYFGGGNTATRSFIIKLSWNDFLTTGGFIYAEYNNGTAYKSSNITVIKNSTVNTGTNLNPPADAPNPKKIVNTLCCNQTIRLGDKPAPITGSQYLNPYEGLPYGVNRRWNITNSWDVIADYINEILYLDYTTELKDITINRELGYVYGGEFPNKSNTVKIKVVPSPILRNEISVTETSNSEGLIELSSLKKSTITGFNSIVNLKVLQDPYYTIQARDPGAEVESYKWEYHDDSLFRNPWITIPNESTASIDFSNPSQLNSEDTNYSIRRIAIYKDISRVSNVIKFIFRGLRYNNTICCDQILKIFSSTEFEKPQIIIGSTPTIDNTIEGATSFTIQSIAYQWQSQVANIGTSIWSDIVGATSKDYEPTQPLSVSTRRGAGFETSYNYRRIAIIKYRYFKDKWINETVSSYSNESSLSGTQNEPFIKIYPNPSTSILNIESIFNISNVKLTISNIMGVVVNSNDFSLENPKLINIDVSNLIPGTYFINIENENIGKIQKTFIKQ
jgi:hypothetical protein